LRKYLSVIPLVLLLCFVVGCQDKAAMAELEQFKAQAALEEANLALAVRAEEAWTNGDIETLREICSPDFVYHFLGQQDMSLEETFEEIKKFKAMFPDGKYTWDDNFVKGNRIATRNRFWGTHSGDIEGFPATGNIVETSALAISRIEDGKIVEMWIGEDMLTFYQQLGYELKPPEEKK
jgi:predicted ester cyclase